MKTISKPTSVDEYIRSYPPDVRKKLTQMRLLIRRIAPEAEERLSYGMPAFFLNGVLVWFAAHTQHIGFYPKANAIKKFRRDLARFKTAKGSVQFPLEQPLPVRLISTMVRYRVLENTRK